MPPPPPRGLVLAAVCLGLAAVPLLGRADDTAPAGKKYALLIGVNKYDKEPLRSLKYSENDVNDLAAVLTDAGFQHIVLMTQSEAAARKDDALAPKVENVHKQLKAFLADRGPGDVVLVAFSGQGVQFKGRGAGFLCPADADPDDPKTLISAAEVYKDLEGCKADVRFLLAGGSRNDPLAASPKFAADPEITLHPQIEKTPGGVAAFFACSAGEKAFDSDELKHSVFFHFVIKGLQGEADLDGDGQVDLDELVRYTKRQTADFVRQSNPDVRQAPELMSVTRGAIPLAKAAEGKEIANSIGMKLKRIRPGKFLMGSPRSEDAPFGEGPQHAVEITQPFCLGVYPVTKGQFATFVKDSGYKTEAETDGKGGSGLKPPNTLEQGPQFTWKDTGWEQTDAHPVVNVTWNDAKAFCDWLSKKEGKAYELPTEAEWEYACRAGAKTDYAFGDDPRAAGDYAWYQDNSGGHTHPVGGKKPNAWGLYDMNGNVWQWCADRYGKYTEDGVRDPKGYTNDPKNEPGNPVLRVLRGGSYSSTAPFCRAALRNRDAPTARDAGFGFRVVLRSAAENP